MKIRLIALSALVFAISPALAYAHPAPTSTAHIHAVVFHDRAPKPHLQTAVAHH